MATYDDFTQRGKKVTIQFSAKRAVRRANNATATGMNKAAELIEKGIKSLAPVDTSRLQESVSVKAVTRGKNPRIEVRTVDYGRWVEIGTRYMGARPFIEPIVKGLRREWEKVVRDTAKEELAKSTKRRR